MRFFIIGLISVYAFQTQAQELKKVISGRGFKNEQEQYYVLKSNPEIRHGKYLKMSKIYGTTLETGFYKNNLKDSVWTEYFPGTKEYIAKGSYRNGKKEGLWQYRKNLNHMLYLSEQGLYKEDKKTGTWQTYNAVGEVIKVYDHSLEKLYFEKPKPDSLDYKVFTEEGWVIRKLDKAPKLKNNLSPLDYSKAVMKEAKLPKNTGAFGKGFVVISFVVDENGFESDHKVEIPYEPAFDKEILRAKKAIQRPWEPGIMEGKPVKTKHSFPVHITVRENGRY